MDMICSPLSNQRVDLAQTLLPNICLADNNASDNKQIDVLIGANYYWNFVTGQIIKTENALTTVQTILGWTLNGNVRVSSFTVNVAHVLLSHGGHELSTDNLKKFWQVEDINEVDTTFNIGKFSEKIDFDGERYSVPLPWKQDHEQIPDNFQNSRNRLTSVFRRLKAEPELLQQYDDIIKQQKRDGIIEQLTEPPPPPGKVHYLPHHYILKEDKSTNKVRIVYDASSNSPSLNDCLEKGPSLLPLLMDILIRFGTYKVAVASDIKQAFLNVAINTPDRDFLRFLWFDDITKENPQLMIYRYTRVIFGMNASQFLLAASIIKHLEKYQSADPDFVLAFLENLYVDDSIGGGDTSDQVFTFYQKAKARLKEAGLILRSNSPTLQAQISKFEIKDPAPPDEKILGITWDTANDEMEIDLSRQKQLAQSDVLLTKRNILKIIASIYDPVGLVSPLVVPFKVFFQKLCTTVNDWDTEVSEELKDEWNSLIQLFSISSKYRLPRYYFANYPLSDLKNITLHGFCDASKRSYAAVVYIIGTLSSGRSIGRIVCSKTKVSPLNELSIPRLELLSCLKKKLDFQKRESRFAVE
ncbi:uncharacterized protein LOC130615087 [Hydractinia symbiolongicarpus]|uniref:uncharacterized protein LOC130615087 n=1 Tax=Hydractinia symbiolongicarpus TaxID=13093 RepID=UPI00254EB923|nr:uncharacterized protein LOC130615087 [Hydractinia symbiolongicarpus]